MHALPLLQSGVRDFHPADGQIVAAGREAAEIHDDGRQGRHRGAFQGDRAQRQSPRNGAEIVIREQPADVILRREDRDDLSRQRRNPCSADRRGPSRRWRPPPRRAWTGRGRSAHWLGSEMPAAKGAFLASGSNSGRPSAWARSIARKPGGSKWAGTPGIVCVAAQLVALSLEMVEKPWSEARITSVSLSRPSAFNASSRLARLLSALRIAASEVGPSMPGTSPAGCRPDCAGCRRDRATNRPERTAFSAP